MKRSKYKLLLTGLDAAQLGEEGLKSLIEEWAEGTGARNVSSGVIRCDADPAKDVMIYSAHFDSSHWTGHGFMGFGVKNPGEPVHNFS